MIRHRDLPGALPLLVAALWPLGVYTQIPLTALRASHIAALAMIVYAGAHWRTRRASRPPFEYWWPAAALLVAALLAWISGGGIGYRALLPHAAFFLGAVILLESRIAAANACLAFTIASAAATLLHWAAHYGFCPPTAFDRDMAVAVTGLASAQTGALLALTGSLAGVFVAFHPGLAMPRRILAAVASLVSFHWLGVVMSRTESLAVPGALRSLYATAPLDFSLILLALWLASRVIARSALRPRDPVMPPRGLVPALLVAGTAGCFHWAVLPDPSVFLFLGILAAHDAPWARDEPAAVPHYALLPALACVLVQVSGVLPLSHADPRNQAARCGERFQARDWARLDKTLDFLLERRPGDPAFTLLRARSLADRGWPEAAASVYCSTTYPAGAKTGISLPDHTRALLDTLRDLASGAPPGERSLFFERALAHSGETDNALSVLALNTEAASAPATADTAVLARALALLLGVPDLAPKLAERDQGELVRLLAGNGVQIRPFPAGFPFGAPLLLRAIPGPAAVEVELWAGLDEAAARRVMWPTGLSPVGRETGAPAGWGEWRQESGAWMLELSTPEGAAGRLALRSGGTIEVESGTGAETLRGPAAIVLYLP